MIRQLGLLLMTFRAAFPREATFQWFVVAVLGFIVRLDHHGVSSSIRWLRLTPGSYETFLAFFRSSAVKMENILAHWLTLVSRHGARTRGGAFVLIADGIKAAKEAECMPGVKRLHQESENSGKAPWILGHHFGVVGLLVRNMEKAFCIPVIAELHEGVVALRRLQEKSVPGLEETERITVVTLMANLLKTVAEKLAEPCVAVVDAYFAVGPTFQAAKTLTGEGGQRLLHVVTRAKDNIVAYEEQPKAYKGRGRRPKHGERLKLNELFSSGARKFSPLRVCVYGEEKDMEFLCLDLIWKPIKDKLRFVLVKDGTKKFILMCSDLNMAPDEIIGLYASRFKIEVTFKMLKHVIGGFCYHFWTTVWRDPKGKSLALSQLDEMDERSKRLMAGAMNAVESFVNIALIATGLLQIIALEHAERVRNLHHWWMRTYPQEVPSEEMVKTVIQHEFYHHFRKFKHTAIYRIIQAKRHQQAQEPMQKAA